MPLKGPVYQHHRKARGNQTVQAAEIVHSAGDQKTVHQARCEKAKVRLLPLHVLLGVGDDEAVALGGEVVFRRFDDGAEKFVGDVGDDKANGFLFSGPEAPGGSVGRIAQLADGLADLFPGVAGDIAGVVDGVGDGGGGNARQPGHVADGDFHWLNPLRS